MEFPYNIQFDEDDDYFDENSEDRNPIKKEDVSSNEDIVGEEDLKLVNRREDVQNIGVIERKQGRQGVAIVDDVIPDPSNELKRCVWNVLREGRNNIIGVFGNRADNVVKALCCNLQEMEEHIIFAGYVDYSNIDVYNSIAAVFWDNIQENRYRKDLEYYRRDIRNTLSRVYDDDQSGFDGGYSPIEGLMNISRRNARDKELLAAVHSMRELNNFSLHSSRRAPKFLIAIDVGMKKMDYKFLHSLEKLDSSDLIIIVYTMLNLYESTEMTQLADKFFETGRYVIATNTGRW